MSEVIPKTPPTPAKPGILTEADKAKILASLNEKIKKACPLCQSNERLLVDGFLSMSISSNPSEFQLGGPQLPCVGVVCMNCGFLSVHAAKVIAPSVMPGGGE